MDSENSEESGHSVVDQFHEGSQHLSESDFIEELESIEPKNTSEEKKLKG